MRSVFGRTWMKYSARWARVPWTSCCGLTAFQPSPPGSKCLDHARVHRVVSQRHRAAFPRSAAVRPRCSVDSRAEVPGSNLHVLASVRRRGFYVRTRSHVLSALQQDRQFTVEHLARDRCRLRFDQAATCRETFLHMCRIRRLQFEMVPTMFDLAPASVAEPKCILKGDGCCVYDMHWRPSPRRWGSRSGAVLGSALGLALGVEVHLGMPWTATLLFLCAASGWSLGRVRELRQRRCRPHSRPDGASGCVDAQHAR